ncbi:hypothetical protein ACGFZK_09860 [Streptomyces sp. NPDC048257]|uniref:hypothetical protein n=1 Tax=Streptomyces sp. NPDC048257 TaxID=3365526 RepID=UPI0037174412
MGFAEQAAGQPGRRVCLCELALVPVLLFALTVTSGFAVQAVPVLLPVLPGVTVTGHWLRAVIASRFALWGLYPAVLLDLLGEAAGPEILRAGPDG